MHARSVVGCGLDGQTGEVFIRRMSPQPGEVAAWISELPQPVSVAYEAGPTGYGLYRYLTGHQIPCQVGAPSKLQRPPGDRRKKNDERDAFQIVRLVRVGDIVEGEPRSVDARQVPEQGLARGEIDIQEYRQRLEALGQARLTTLFVGRRAILLGSLGAVASKQMDGRGEHLDPLPPAGRATTGWASAASSAPRRSTAPARPVSQ